VHGLGVLSRRRPSIPGGQVSPTAGPIDDFDPYLRVMKAHRIQVVTVSAREAGCSKPQQMSNNYDNPFVAYVYGSTTAIAVSLSASGVS
jgi:hypothetical protein